MCICVCVCVCECFFVCVFVCVLVMACDRFHPERHVVWAAAAAETVVVGTCRSFKPKSVHETEVFLQNCDDVLFTGRST